MQHIVQIAYKLCAICTFTNTQRNFEIMQIDKSCTTGILPASILALVG